jgi:23S rRNA pseudouridine2605 synthase
MRINKYVAQSSELSRRAADEAIAMNRVKVNGQKPDAGYDVQPTDTVTLDDERITPDVNMVTIMLNKPIGYVCSRDGQGSRTIYELLPANLQHLNPVGRLDKNSSGLLLLTNDGQLAQDLTHPSKQKNKTYKVGLDTPLQPLHRQMISDHGVSLEDGPSKFELERSTDGDDRNWEVTMHEGRNRQIRRTFAALGYHVSTLHRTHFGSYDLGSLKPGNAKKL